MALQKCMAKLQVEWVFDVEVLQKFCLRFWKLDENVHSMNKPFDENPFRWKPVLMKTRFDENPLQQIAHAWQFIKFKNRNAKTLSKSGVSMVLWDNNWRFGRKIFECIETRQTGLLLLTTKTVFFANWDQNLTFFVS
jgi:hypothetical protein